MKRFVQTLALIMVIAAIPAIVHAKKKPTKEVTYKVVLDCQDCVDKVMKNIPYEKGVKDVKASIEKQEVKVVFVAEKNCPENIKKAIEKLDFDVEIKSPKSCNKAESTCCKNEENKGCYKK